MGIYDEGKRLAEAADAKLTSLAEAVTARGATKWVILGLVLAAFAIVALVLWPAKAHATGGHHVAPVIVKTPVVVPPPAPAAPAPAASAASSPAQQPATYAGNGAGLAGQIAFACVAIAFWYVICASESRRNPDGFWARYLCLRPTAYRPPPTPEHMLPTFGNP